MTEINPHWVSGKWVSGSCKTDRLCTKVNDNEEVSVTLKFGEQT